MAQWEIVAKGGSKLICARCGRKVETIFRPNDQRSEQGVCEECLKLPPVKKTRKAKS